MVQRIQAIWLGLRPGRERTRGLLLGATACAGFMAACDAPKDEDIRVGVIAYTSGSRRETSGLGTVDGAKLAVAEINAQGGIPIGGRRHPMRLIVVDGGDKADIATRVARGLINLDSVSALIGPQFSRDAIPVAMLADAAGVPMITPMSSHPAVTAGRRWVFRIAYLNEFQSEVLAGFARDRLGAKRAAILYDVANDYSRDLATSFRRHFEAAGGTIVADENYTSDLEGDFRPQLQRIGRSGAEVLFSPNYWSADSLQLLQAARLGLTIPFLGTDSWDPTITSDLGSNQVVYSATQWHPRIGTAESDGYISRFQAQYGRAPNATSAATYDAVRLLADAFERAGTLDLEAVRQALASTGGYRGVTGVLTFGDGGDPSRSAVILRTTRDGVGFVEQVRP